MEIARFVFSVARSMDVSRLFFPFFERLISIKLISSSLFLVEEYMNAVKALKLPIATHNLGVINRAVELFTRLPRAKALEQMKRSTPAELEVVTVSYNSYTPPFSSRSRR